MTRDDRPPVKLTVTVSAALAEAVEDYVARGSYGSLNDFLEQAVWGRIQDEETSPEEHAAMMKSLDEALNDPRPPIPADEVFERLRRRIDARTGLRRREA